MTPLAVSVKTAAAMVDVSESTIREAINRQEIPAFRIGRAVRLYVADLEAWTEGLVRVGSEDDR